MLIEAMEIEDKDDGGDTDKEEWFYAEDANRTRGLLIKGLSDDHGRHARPDENTWAAWECAENGAYQRQNIKQKFRAMIQKYEC